MPLSSISNCIIYSFYFVTLSAIHPLASVNFIEFVIKFNNTYFSLLRSVDKNYGISSAIKISRKILLNSIYL